MPDEVVQIIGSAVAGTLLCAGIAKLYIAKSLKDLEAALSMCYQINEKLAAISVRLDRFDTMERMVTDMDRKIIALEAKRAGYRPRRMRPSKSSKPGTNSRHNQG